MFLRELMAVNIRPAMCVLGPHGCQWYPENGLPSHELESLLAITKHRNTSRHLSNKRNRSEYTRAPTPKDER